MDEAVMDVEQVETPVEPGGEGQGQTQDGAQQQQAADDPYSSKSSREYSAWLKTLRDSGDPVAAKYARLAKDNHGSMYALRQLDPKGIDGVRERYALLDSVIHNDPERGELKGADAIAALQDSVREYSEIDQLLAEGDPRALESLGDDFNAGLAKLAPSILDRIEQSDPEGYAAAVLPHFVKALANSELVSNFNGLVDVLNEAPPSWLTEQQKTAWAADQQRKIVALAGKMGGWLNAQAEKAGKLPGKDGSVSRGTNGKGNTIKTSSEEETWRTEQQNHHWNTNIAPSTDKHAADKFNELFRPYAKRLNLDKGTTDALKMEFSKRVANYAHKEVPDGKGGIKLNPYSEQIGRYRAMRNPNSETVSNYVNVEFDKHAKTVMDALVTERYKPFLNGKPHNPQGINGAGKGAPPPAKGVQMVTVRPPDDQILHRERTLDQIHKRIFPLKNGKVVQLQA